MFPYIETEDGFQTLIDEKSYPVQSSHPHYDELYEAVSNNDSDKFISLFSKASVVEQTFKDTEITVRDGVVYYYDEVLHNVVTDKIVSLSEKGLNPQPMINFLGNLMNNPSARAINELYNFLAHQKLPITEDGCFIAYKSVANNFLDKHSGKIDNSPGKVIEIRRNLVDDDKEKHCSHGLHVGALEYAGPGGWYNCSDDKILIVKVNPADAVSVPSDHDGTKLRVCKYEVLSEYKAELDENYYPSPQPAVIEEVDENEDICDVCGDNCGYSCYDDYEDSWYDDEDEDY